MNSSDSSDTETEQMNTHRATKWSCACGSDEATAKETVVTVGYEVDDVVCPNCGSLMRWYSDGVYDYESGRYIEG